jgi:hypothetical protein
LRVIRHEQFEQQLKCAIDVFLEMNFTVAVHNAYAHSLFVQVNATDELSGNACIFS